VNGGSFTIAMRQRSAATSLSLRSATDFRMDSMTTSNRTIMPFALLTADSAKLSIEAIKPDYQGWDDAKTVLAGQRLVPHVWDTCHT
jgi:hypothetical protein